MCSCKPRQQWRGFSFAPNSDVHRTANPFFTVDGVLDIVGLEVRSQVRPGWTTTKIVTATDLSWLAGGKGCIIRPLSSNGIYVNVGVAETAADAAVVYVS